MKSDAAGARKPIVLMELKRDPRVFRLICGGATRTARRLRH